MMEALGTRVSKLGYLVNQVLNEWGFRYFCISLYNSTQIREFEPDDLDVELCGFKLFN